MASSTSSKVDLLRRADSALVSINKFLIGTTLAIMVTLVFVNVVTRYVLNLSFDWIEEVTRYMMIWLVYLAAGLALRQGNHVAVMMLVELLPPPIRRIVRAVVLIVLALFMAAIGCLGWRYAMFAWYRTTPILDLSYGMLYLAIPAGALLVILHILADWTGLLEQSEIGVDDAAPSRDVA